MKPAKLDRVTDASPGQWSSVPLFSDLMHYIKCRYDLTISLCIHIVNPACKGQER